jgi:hypothetical protein
VFQINGDQDLKLTAEETALILDALAELPYKRTANLIPKIIRQVQENAKPKEAEPDDKPKD